MCAPQDERCQGLVEPVLDVAVLELLRRLAGVVASVEDERGQGFVEPA